MPVASVQKALSRSQVPVLLFLLACFTPESRASAETTFELRGMIVQADGISFQNARPIVQLRGPDLPASLSTVADSKGRFRFKKVKTGMYLLTAFVPRVARVNRTIEIGPGLADDKGRINIDLKLGSRPRTPGRFQVPATQLSVPEKARAEYSKGLRRLANLHHRRTLGDCICIFLGRGARLFPSGLPQFGLIPRHSVPTAASNTVKPGPATTGARFGMERRTIVRLSGA